MKTKEEILLNELQKASGNYCLSLDHLRNADAIFAAMEQYANQSKFIDVKDEPKPKLGQKALVIQNPLTTATREPLFAIYNGEKFAPYAEDTISGFEIGRTWADITHWMPLPKTNNKEFNHIRIHEYYDGILLFTCKDDKSEDYVFCLLDEDKQTYIGCHISSPQFNNFILGLVDLRKLFEIDLKALYIGKFTGKDSFFAIPHEGEVTEDMLPATGLVLTPEKSNT